MPRPRHVTIKMPGRKLSVGNLRSTWIKTSSGHPAGFGMIRSISRWYRGRFVAPIGLAVLAVLLGRIEIFAEPHGDGSGAYRKGRRAAERVVARRNESPSSAPPRYPRRIPVGPLYPNPARRRVRSPGDRARGSPREEAGRFDIFIIGGGSGTAFNKSLGAEGGKVVQAFVRKGGGALASCAGGYSFVTAPTRP